MSSTNYSFCSFCTLPASRIWFEGETCRVIKDAFPITNGHTLVLPKRHVQSLFELEENELHEIYKLLKKARNTLIDELGCDGFNVGINDGVSAGQTVPHVHIHLIPRLIGDLEDPRGGVRWIFPDKAKYWS
jgi:diadenosine tetraphosphate (Ap4A) HIT family hydrolase